MNKKGFTLIELLVTITILGMITAMVTPSIISLQDSNKKKKFELYGKTLVEAAKLYVQKEGVDITRHGSNSWLGCVEITYQDLIDSDLIKPYNDSDYDCSTSKIRYTKNRNEPDSYTYHLTCKAKVSKKKDYDINNIPNYYCTAVFVGCNKGENAVTKLINKANSGSLDYNSASSTQKKEMWTYTQSATSQFRANTEYRYIGANPNNYIKFNNELWRIIGIFETEDGTGKIEKRLKIVRNESIGNYSWDNKNPSTGAETDSGKNNWPDARLNYLLNSGHDSETTGGSLYWNRKSGNCYSGLNNATTPCDFTNTGLSSNAKSMIDNAKWYLGGSNTYNDVTPIMFYQRERGTAVYSGRSASWIGKVGVMYPSDYGYATSGGSSTNRNSCLAKELWNWDSSSYTDCKNNDWLYKNSYSWFITPYIDNSGASYSVKSNAYVGYEYNYAPDPVFPTVYLKSSIAFSDGDGSSSSPYIIDECEE